MKKNHRFILAAVVLAAAIFIVLLLCGIFVVHRFGEAQFVVNVLNQNAAAAKSSMQIHTAGTMTQRRFNTRQYVNELHRIDASLCPKKFQLAWLDYVQAWEREAEQTPDKVLGELYLGLIGVATKSSALEKMVAKPIEATDAVERAWQNLERVALEYDVRIAHQ